ncbi:MAG TPA: phosphate ABC transporter, permease protein PstA, partial [Thermoanaerobaculia bacterium]|nr:phosphate ABC transporter, permease protein PstA [Thermoanaerobaculia bacterium]
MTGRIGDAAATARREGAMPPPPEPARPSLLSAGGGRWRGDFLGQSLTWLCAGALAFNVLLILALLALIVYRGAGYYWQKDLERLQLADGSVVLGEVDRRERRPVAEWDDPDRPLYRIRLEVGNRDVTGSDFVWVDETAIVEREKPPDAVVLERLEWGNFYGSMVELRADERVVARGSDAVWRDFAPLHRAKLALRETIRALEKREIGDINYEIEKRRLALRRLDLAGGAAAAQRQRRAGPAQEIAELEQQYQQLAERLFAMRGELQREVLVMETAGGVRKEIPVGMVARALRPNAMGVGATARLYLARVWEFVSDDPRESNTEGGIFPAIFGTVLMVFLMTFVAAPFGVLAALYLREYARQGLL